MVPAVVRCLPLAEEERRRKGWEGRSQKKCITPSRTSAHPRWSHPTIFIPPTLFRIYPTHIPLKYHREKRAPLPGQLNHPVASWQSPYSFWSHYSRASVLGVLPAPITLAVPIPLLPRPLATLAVASHHFVESSALATVEQAEAGER